jgi:putative methionine-R-sulfoxide reductase with GAF domain
VTSAAASAPAPDDRLRDIQALTDVTLSYLDAEELLTELLDRVKAVLQADTAAVLLLDRPTGQLVATAASGLEEEVRQAVRVPLGSGFAGRVAAARQPVIIDDVDNTKVVNPILVAKGIRSLIGVPLITHGAVIGVLHVGSLTPRKFTAPDAELLKLAADRAAVAVQSVVSRADRAAASALQRSLVPSALPAIPGTDMAARYVPGRAVVGGDWYDVFMMPSREICVVIGDVAGAGLPAAVIMGRMRSALRAYALETTDPAEVLGRLDRKMQHFEPEVMATVLCAVFDPSLECVRISSAGHLPPVVALPGEPAALAEVPADLLIGVSKDEHRHVTTLEVPPGTLLCFYTDGLVERRDRPLDDGLKELCGAIEPGSPDAACASLMRTLIGREVVRDDIALLIVRRLPVSAAPARAS